MAMASLEKRMSRKKKAVSTQRQKQRAGVAGNLGAIAEIAERQTILPEMIGMTDPERFITSKRIKGEKKLRRQGNRKVVIIVGVHVAIAREDPATQESSGR